MGTRIPDTPPFIAPVPDNTQRPLWSVMIPAYNCIAYLKEAIECVLQQDIGPEEMQIEVIDDCSTDGDVEALVKTVGKGRVHFFQQKENRGSLRNFETCLNRAKGQRVHILHGDDRVAVGFYREIDHLFLSYPEAGAAFTNNSFINRAGQLLHVKPPIKNESGIIDDFLLKIANYQRLEPPAIVVKRSVYEQLGGFYAVHYGEDWEMWTRIAAHFPIAYSPKCLAAYRALDNNNITYKSVLLGQNVKDLITVINIIQAYLPIEQRKKLKKKALEHYAVYNIKIANNLLAYDKDTAFIQIRGALQMCKSLKVIGWMLRFYVIHFSFYKQLKRFKNDKLEKFGKLRLR